MTLFFTYLNFLICLFAVWNIFVILWKLTNKFSKTWHLWGTILSVGIGIAILWLMLFNPEFTFTWKMFWFWLLVFINNRGCIYDLIINIIWKKYGDLPSIFYIDNKGLNKILMNTIGRLIKLFKKNDSFVMLRIKRKGLWILRSVLIIINILILFV
jgi:hypothetical protein